MIRAYRFHGLLAGLASLSFLAGPSHAQTTPPLAQGEATPTPPSTPPAPTDPVAPTPAPSETAPPTSPGSVPPPPTDANITPVPPASPAVPAADAEAAAQAEAAALEQQFAEKAVDDDEGVSLDLYGFADFGFSHSFEISPMAPYDSFSIGNLNLYLASKLGDSWQSLAEVRFSYLPHGTTPGGLFSQAERTDTTVADYTDLGRPARWGGIMIERAYLEYLAHPLLNVRAGHFLSPYGIWNVDHGSPVIIGTRPPFIVAEGIIPESQTGLEIYGTYHLDPVQLGYHLTLSNGRGPLDTYQDLNDNKGVGGRLFARADTPAGSFTLGVSGYAGRYTDRDQALTSTGFTWPVVLDYKERSLTADLKWEFGGLLLQSEGMVNDVIYDRHRPVDSMALEGPPGFLADYRRFGGYVLLGHRFDFGGIMPFIGGESFESGSPSGLDSAALFGGLNVRPIPRVVLKAQYTYAWLFPDTPNPALEDAHYNTIELQAAWSF